MAADSMISGVLTTGVGFNSSAADKNSPEKIRDAASQFEALLIGQVLKASHEDDGEGEGWLGTGEDQTAGSVMGLAESYFARAMAARGGFGLANMVAAGLQHRVSVDAPEAAGPPSSSSPGQSPQPAAAQPTD